MKTNPVADISTADYIVYSDEVSEDERERELLEFQANVGEDNEKSPMLDFIAMAVRRGDMDIAAKLIRKRRNALLARSDSQMSLDRLNLTMPKGLLFSDWLKFFQQIAQMLTGDWAKYRQALRDIPQQEGFPFNITWPDKPEE